MHHRVVCYVPALPLWLRVCWYHCHQCVPWGNWLRGWRAPLGHPIIGCQEPLQGMEQIPLPATITCFSDLLHRDKLSSPVCCATDVDWWLSVFMQGGFPKDAEMDRMLTCFPQGEWCSLRWWGKLKCITLLPAACLLWTLSLENHPRQDAGP